jgi:hypothetical protein
MRDMKRTQVVHECDVCGDGATTVTVAFAGEYPWSVDLCEEHAAPIRLLEARGVQSAAPRKPAIRPPKTKKEGRPKTTHKVKLK